MKPLSNKTVVMCRVEQYGWEGHPTWFPGYGYSTTRVGPTMPAIICWKMEGRSNRMSWIIDIRDIRYAQMDALLCVLPTIKDTGPEVWELNLDEYRDIFGREGKYREGL